MGATMKVKARARNARIEASLAGGLRRHAEGARCDGVSGLGPDPQRGTAEVRAFPCRPGGSARCSRAPVVDALRRRLLRVGRPPRLPTRRRRRSSKWWIAPGELDVTMSPQWRMRQ